MQRLIGLLILLAGIIGAHYSISNVFRQDRANRRFVPVPAQVYSTSIRSQPKIRGPTRYSVDAAYAYEFEDQRYRSTQVTAINSTSTSRAYAQDLFNRIDGASEDRQRAAQGLLDRLDGINNDGGRQGGAFPSTAYVDPLNPADAILVREYSFFPYGVGMGSLLAAAVGAGMLAGVIARGRGEMAAVAFDDTDWRLLLPTEPLRRQYNDALAWLIGGSVAILVMPGHWILIAGQIGPAAFISAALAVGFVAWLAVNAYRRWNVCRHLSDARLLINPAPLQRGQPFAVKLGVDAYSSLRVDQAVARVLCLEHYCEQRDSKTHYGRRTRAEKTITFCSQTTVRAGEELTGHGETIFDRDLPPTTKSIFKSYPHYTWEIRLTLALEGMVDYNAVFPLEVD